MPNNENCSEAFLSYQAEPDVYWFVVRTRGSHWSLPLGHPRVTRTDAGETKPERGDRVVAGARGAASFTGADIEATSCGSAPFGSLVVFSEMTAIRLQEGFLDLKNWTLERKPKDYQFHVLNWCLGVRMGNADFEFDVGV